MFDSITVEIQDIALPSGLGVAKLAGKTIFVFDATYFDKVKIDIVKEKKNFSIAKVNEYVELSKFRQHPTCKHFDICGGCCLQNLNYSKQLEIKEKYLFETLKRIAKLDLENIDKSKIVASSDIYFYRNKIELFFENQKGKTVLGLNKKNFSTKDTERIFQISECKIFAEQLPKIVEEILDFANKTKYKDSLVSLILKHTKFTNQMMLILLVSSLIDENYFKILEEKFVKLNLNSCYVILKDFTKNKFLKQIHIFGQRYLEEIFLDRIFRIYPQTFLQPNIKSAKFLYEKLLELITITNSKRVLSFYCGSGFFEILIAKNLEKVIGIDMSQDNILCAKENVLINNLDNCFFYKSKVEDLIDIPAKEKIELLLLDPPRAGLSNSAIDLILKLAIPKIIYISCNPASLARDLFKLSNFYKVKHLASFDFFPHTAHLESLVFMERL